MKLLTKFPNFLPSVPPVAMVTILSPWIKHALFWAYASLGMIALLAIVGACDLMVLRCKSIREQLNNAPLADLGGGGR